MFIPTQTIFIRIFHFSSLHYCIRMCVYLCASIYKSSVMCLVLLLFFYTHVNDSCAFYYTNKRTKNVPKENLAKLCVSMHIHTFRQYWRCHRFYYFIFYSSFCCHCPLQLSSTIFRFIFVVAIVIITYIPNYNKCACVYKHYKLMTTYTCTLQHCVQHYENNKKNENKNCQALQKINRFET